MSQFEGFDKFSFFEPQPCKFEKKSKLLEKPNLEKTILQINCDKMNLNL
jgi:hypothetical protein